MLEVFASKEVPSSLHILLGRGGGGGGALEREISCLEMEGEFF